MQSRIAIITIITLLAALAACQSTQNTSRASSSPDEVILEADRLFAEGKLQSALAKYSTYVYSPFPDKSQLSYAKYRIGLCHYLMQDYGEALITLESLLKNEPGFSMAADAQEIIAKCKVQVAEAKQAVFEQETARQQSVEQAQETIRSNPNSAPAHYEFGNKLWENGNFQEAVKQYEEAIKLDSRYEQDATILNRVRVTGQGEFVVRDPLLNLQQGPVVITDVQKQTRERRNWLGTNESIIVSGKVKNQGLRDVRNVSVNVTLSDFFERVQETRQIPVGNLRAGETKPFSVMLGGYSGSANDNLQVRTQVSYDE